jgi:hypothetical protein
MAKPYWASEEPEILTTDANEFRFFKRARKVQVFKRLEGTPRGIAKGSVMDLEKLVGEVRERLLAILRSD